MNKTTNKSSRAGQTREKTKRKVVWTPPSYLDTPNAPSGFRHRWVRAEILGYVDTKNPAIPDGKYAGVIGHGGLVLTRVPEEIAQARADYFSKLGRDQIEAVDNDLLKEQHKSMPINIDRQSRTTFGGTKK